MFNLVKKCLNKITGSAEDTLLRLDVKDRDLIARIRKKNLLTCRTRNLPAS